MDWLKLVRLTTSQQLPTCSTVRRGPNTFVVNSRMTGY